MGYRVEVHPTLSGDVSRRPDFRLEKTELRPFYVEAAVVMDLSREAAAAEARVNQVYDALNGIDSPNFFLSLEVEGAPTTPVPGRELRRAIEEFLSRQDPDACARALADQGLDGLPCQTFDHDGWKVRYSPFPKSPAARGAAGLRPIGIVGPSQPSRLDKISGLKNTIRKKASKYGELDEPYVIAANAVSQHLSLDDIAEALFGSVVMVSYQRDPRPRPERLPDGVWLGRAGPVYRRVSAVAIVSLLLPWSIARTEIRVCHNPWAKLPLDQALAELPGLIVSDRGPHVRDGALPKDLFGLPDGWPGED